MKVLLCLAHVLRLVKMTWTKIVIETELTSGTRSKIEITKLSEHKLMYRSIGLE